MENVVRFYTQDGKWYADMPGHTLEENEMVCGSDTLLDILSPGGKDIYIKFSDIEPEDGSYMSKFELISHDGYTGGVYRNVDDHREIYLCNVAHDIFHEHPGEIYVIGYEYKNNII